MRGVLTYVVPCTVVAVTEEALITPLTTLANVISAFANLAFAVIDEKKVLTVTFWVLAVPAVFDTSTKTSAFAGADPAPNPVIFGIILPYKMEGAEAPTNILM